MLYPRTLILSLHGSLEAWSQHRIIWVGHDVTHQAGAVAQRNVGRRLVLTEGDFVTTAREELGVHQAAFRLVESK